MADPRTAAAQMGLLVGVPGARAPAGGAIPPSAAASTPHGALPLDARSLRVLPHGALGGRTLVDALRANAVHTQKGITFLRSDGTESHRAYDVLWTETRRRAAALRELGLRPGDRLALTLPEPDDFVLTFYAAVAAGVVPVPLYPPRTLARLDTYVDSMRRILATAGARHVVASPAVVPALGDLGDTRLVTTTELAAATHVPDDAPFRPTGDDLAFLQFTSGSTSQPKGVMVTHANLAANAHAIMFDGLRADPAIDKGVSWLPLYHDMGLIGFVVAPLFAEVPVVLMPTTAFVRRPSSWLDAIHRHRGTITFAPNFAFALAVQSIGPRHMTGWDLSCLRALGCGAEPIHAPTIRAFLEKFAAVGLSPKAILPSYGMAEATLAISFCRLDDELHVDRCDPQALARGRAVPTHDAGAIEIVACGVPFPGHSLAIVDDADRALPDRTVGEIVVSGPSTTTGYYRNEEATREAFREGRLHTGDLGYVADGELYVCGRKKDIIIVHGRNYFPQDIERVVSDVEGVRSGHVAVFTMPRRATGAEVGARDPAANASASDEESLVVVAEAQKSDGDEAAELRRKIASAVYEHIGLRIDEVHLIRRGTLPKTSSGKVRRRETRARVEARTLDCTGSEE